ncbi:unnamed protein product [Heterobilharzia americana]|nr:unnamed protein product [Heterobilharzia americana]
MSTISKHYPTLSHALSVEGKHGILIRNPSTNHSNQTELNDTSLKTLQKGDISCKTDLFSSYISRYQDALHRSNTLDRYVATGSPVSPYSSISNQTFYTDCNKMKLDDQLNQEHYIQDPDNISDTTSTTNHSSNKHIEENKSKLTSKKVVQWSDHREVSTRHQIIGRYLEITWKFTENTLTSLFLSTKSTFCKEQNIDKNEKILNKSSLIMSTEKLLQLGNNIRQLTATTDFFPAGLMSVLRKQALKCKEYAVWRNWYEECQVYKNMKYEGITYDIGDFQVLIDIQKKRDYMNSYRTCDHLDHTSLYSIYLNYHKQLTEEKRSYTQLQDATCHTIMLHIIKLFINDEHSWMKILSMIQVTIQSSGISSVVHKFNVIIPDSYSTLLLKVYKAYELSRRLDLNFTRLIIILRNLSFNEYGICIKGFDCTLRSQQNKQEDVHLSIESMKFHNFINNHCKLK